MSHRFSDITGAEDPQLAEGCKGNIARTKESETKLKLKLKLKLKFPKPTLVLVLSLGSAIVGYYKVNYMRVISALLQTMELYPFRIS